jgi:Peptidase family M28
MLFLNNGEERGLLGAKWLVNTSLISNVKAYVNLEGGGTGG